MTPYSNPLPLPPGLEAQRMWWRWPLGEIGSRLALGEHVGPLMAARDADAHFGQWAASPRSRTVYHVPQPLVGYEPVADNPFRNTRPPSTEPWPCRIKAVSEKFRGCCRMHCLREWSC